MIIALLNNNIVTSVLDIGDSEPTREVIDSCSMVVDVTNMDPVPSVGWELFGNKLQPLDLKRKDEERYTKRALVKDSILAWMAAGNVDRMRNGIWSLADLTALTYDGELKLVLDDVNTLSFELALAKIDSVTNPLITSDIKATWKGKLIQNLF